MKMPLTWAIGFLDGLRDRFDPRDPALELNVVRMHTRTTETTIISVTRPREIHKRGKLCGNQDRDRHV